MTAKAMHAEIMAVGDELTSGQRLDTNSQWLSERLGNIGISVEYHTTVGDDFDRMVAALQVSAGRSDILLITGGLGPTADDLTRQAMAAAAGKELVRDDDVVAHIESLFRRYGRTMPPQNEVQAMFPDGSQVIPNPHGTAPGIAMTIATAPDRQPCQVFALPGVPAEMKQMWEESVRPALQQRVGSTRTIEHRRIKCFGVGESHLESMLPDLIRRGRTPRVGITVHRATITLRVTAEGDDTDDCLRQMEPTLQTIHESLGALVFGAEDEELEHAVIKLLRAKQRTLAVVEWGTMGVASHWLAIADGEQGQSLRGTTLVTNLATAQRLLRSPDGVDPVPDDRRELVSALAGWGAQVFEADYGLAIGPRPAADDAEPVIHLALSAPEGVTIKSRPYVGHPDLLIERAAKQALDLLRLALNAD